MLGRGGNKESRTCSIYRVVVRIILVVMRLKFPCQQSDFIRVWEMDYRSNYVSTAKSILTFRTLSQACHYISYP